MFYCAHQPENTIALLLIAAAKKTTQLFNFSAGSNQMNKLLCFENEMINSSSIHRRSASTVETKKGLKGQVFSNLTSVAAAVIYVFISCKWPQLCQ